MYRTIHTELWTDDKVIALEPLGKLLFLYLITNPHAHLSGLYYLPKSFIIEETGMSGRGIDTLLHTLSIPYLIQYDERLRVVFVVNMFEYQAKGPKNLKCAASHLLTLHNSMLIQAFIKRYPEITPFVSDTLSDTLSIGDTSTPVPVPVLLTLPNPNLQSNPQTEKKGMNGHAKKLLRSICEEDRPTPKHLEFARSLGIDPGPEWGKFKNYCLAHDKRYANFEAAFRNWLANSVTMGRK